MEIVCLACGKKTSECYCEICGLYNEKMNFNIIQKLNNIEILLTLYNKNIKYYKIKNNGEIIFYKKGINLLFNWINNEWIHLNLEEIASLRCLLSYLQNNKLLNVSEFALLFFGYTSFYNSEFKKYYDFWKNKAIKTGSYIAINNINKKGIQSVIYTLENEKPYQEIPSRIENGVINIGYISYNDRIFELFKYVPHYLGNYRTNLDEIIQKDIDKLTIRETIQYLSYIYGHECVHGGFIASAIDDGILLKLLKHCLEL